MLGKSLKEIAHSLENDAPKVIIQDGEIPTFRFSTERTLALQWLREFSPRQDVFFPIENVLAALNISVHYEDMGSDSDLSGYIEKRHNGWHIGVNKYEVIGRQRFTLAHELAHLLFHRQILNGKFSEAIKLFRSEENMVHVEMEANAFAADLLMPSDRFRQLWPNNSLQTMSEIFRVSIYAVEYRAKKLSLSEKKV